jgi:glycosyltransferase involved in cell wall biosynthesis
MRHDLPSDRPLNILHYMAFVSPINFGMSEDEYVAYSSTYEPRSLLLAALRDRLGWKVALHLLTEGRSYCRSEPPLSIPIHFHRLRGRTLLSIASRMSAVARRRIRLSGSLDLLAQLRRNRPDVFVFRGNMFSLFSHRLARWLIRQGIPYHYESHGAGVVLDRGCRDFIYGAAKVVVLTEAARQEFLKGYGLPSERVIIVSNGVAIDQFAPGDKPGTAYPRLAFSGRLSRAKGFDLALRTLHEVRKRWPGAVLEVAGSAWPGEGSFSKDALKKVCEADRAAVKLLGWVSKDELIGLYRRADLLLFPSRIPGEGDGEGEPRTVLEAMATTTPVAAIAESGGHCEIIAASDTGVIAPKADCFGESVCAYLEDAKRVGRDGAAARHYVVTNHSIDVVYETYRRCYVDTVQMAETSA